MGDVKEAIRWAVKLVLVLGGVGGCVVVVVAVVVVVILVRMDLEVGFVRFYSVLFWRLGGYRCLDSLLDGEVCDAEDYRAGKNYIPLYFRGCRLCRLSREFDIATRSGEMSFSRANMALRNCSAIVYNGLFLGVLPRRRNGSRVTTADLVVAGTPTASHEDFLARYRSRGRATEEPKRTRHPRG